MPVRNVTKDYPPTLLIHGTADTDVPYEESVMMEREFKKHGVDFKFITLQNSEHGFRGADPQAVEDAYAAIVPFTDARVKKA
jgi:dipeptidyl aminopeptidase/acylaminoacyl peptidase